MRLPSVSLFDEAQAAYWWTLCVCAGRESASSARLVCTRSADLLGRCGTILLKRCTAAVVARGFRVQEDRLGWTAGPWTELYSAGIEFRVVQVVNSSCL